MMRSAVQIAVTTLVAGSCVVAMTTPATAMQSDSSARTTGPSGKFVMYQNDNFEGQEESRYKYDDNLHNDSCSGCDPGPGGNFGDDMSSFVNNTKYWWAIYKDQRTASTGSDDVWCVKPFSNDKDLGNNGFSDLEDEISSIRRKDTTQPRIPRCGDKGHIIGHAN